jgi:hypothetical protein
MGLKKREKKHVWAHEVPSIGNKIGHMKVQEEKKYILPYPYVFQIKEREIHDRSGLFSSSTFHTLAQS